MILVTFSGLDGSGKSTQVEMLAKSLRADGLRVYRMVTLYASVTGWATLLREYRQRKRRPETAARTAEQRAYAGARTFSQDRATWVARLRRWIAYPVDCAALTIWLLAVRLGGYDAVICDRYLYDKLVNLPDPTCRFAKLLLVCTPRPDAAFFLEIQPEIAAARRPEHTPDYFAAKNAGYYALVHSGLGLELLPAGRVEETHRLVRERVGPLLPRASDAHAVVE